MRSWKPSALHWDSNRGSNGSLEAAHEELLVISRISHPSKGHGCPHRCAPEQLQCSGRRPWGKRSKPAISVRDPRYYLRKKPGADPSSNSQLALAFWNARGLFNEQYEFVEFLRESNASFGGVCECTMRISRVANGSGSQVMRTCRRRNTLKADWVWEPMSTPRDSQMPLWC